MSEHITETSPVTLWNFIHKNPNLTIIAISEAPVIKQQYKSSTVRSILSAMCVSGILIKDNNDKVKTYRINDIFPDANKAVTFMYAFKEMSNENEDNIIKTVFSITVAAKIKNLRMEIFVYTGRFLSLSGLINHLFDNRTFFENEYNKKVESLISKINQTGDFKDKELPITIIEKPSPMDKLLNFFKNMSFSYP